MVWLHRALLCDFSFELKLFSPELVFSFKKMRSTSRVVAVTALVAAAIAANTTLADVCTVSKTCRTAFLPMGLYWVSTSYAPLGSFGENVSACFFLFAHLDPAMVVPGG